MKTLLTIIVLSFILTINSFSQGFKVPPPIENEFFNASVGSWVSDEYEVMGMKCIDETTFNWALNNQFLEMKSVSNTGTDNKFQTIGYMGIDKDGNMKGWFFDIMGMEGVTEFTGKVNGMTATIEGGNKYMKSKGTMTIEGGVMTQTFSFTYQDEEGNEQTMELTTTSRKQ
ncbi:hypothetical protein ACFLSV_04890 [Bacteroidota bacterium]